MVIVLMMSMVFQQTSGAVESGTRRVQSQTALRNILGVIARDLALAVDSGDYPGIDNMFISSNEKRIDRIGFVALTGTPEKRMLQWIEFRYVNKSVQRSCGDLIWEPAQKKWRYPAANWVSLNPDDPLEEFRFEVVLPPNASQLDFPFPLRVGVQGSLATRGGASHVSGQSAGKDRKFDTEDDILVGAGDK